MAARSAVMGSRAADFAAGFCPLRRAIGSVPEDFSLRASHASPGPISGWRRHCLLLAIYSVFPSPRFRARLRHPQIAVYRTFSDCRERDSYSSHKSFMDSKLRFWKFRDTSKSTSNMQALELKTAPAVHRSSRRAAACFGTICGSEGPGAGAPSGRCTKVTGAKSAKTPACGTAE